jgi:acid phosphatase
MKDKQDISPQDWPRTKRPTRRRDLPWTLARVFAFAIVGMCQIGPWIALAFMPTVALADSSSQFNLYRHLGMLGPPADGPLNMSKSFRPGTTPPGCKLEKAFLIHRHGSNEPFNGPNELIKELTAYINDNAPMFSVPQVEPPPGFAFLENGGWNNSFTTYTLTTPGRQQLYRRGVAMKNNYPDLFTNRVLTADVGRIVESARWFMLGYYGPDADSTATLDRLPEDSSVVSWITPMYTCDGWDFSFHVKAVKAWGKVYLPPITKRINRILADAYPLVSFTAAHVHGMLYACAYGTAVNGLDSSQWCPVFLPEEILDFEYENDILMRTGFGYDLPNNMGPVMGSLLVSNVTAFFQNTSSPNLSLNFVHDSTIGLGLSALGLAYDESYPITGPVNATRAWRTSNQVPFAAHMLWKKLSCQDEERIQLLLNDINFDLRPTGCNSDEFGTCSMVDFLASETVAAAISVMHGDARWEAACVETVPNTMGARSKPRAC